MNKAILLSIRPEWVAKILNGEKTIEIRKKFPKDYVGWVYIYCTKGKPILWGKAYEVDNEIMCQPVLNGKVVARFWCDKVEEFNCCLCPYCKKNNLGYEHFIDNGVYKVIWKQKINLVDDNDKFNNPEIYKDDGVVFERNDKYLDTMLKNEDFAKMCLTPQELLDYIKLGHRGYAIHFSKLEIFDRPKELSEFSLYRCNTCDLRICSYCDTHLTKAPQNYLYIK